MTIIGQDADVRTTRILVPAYVVTMLFSAGLMFLVQPMFARMALPLLGGTPAVWAIAMVFFQGLLLGGYAYAYLLKKYVPPLFAVPLHVVLMAGAIFSLPVSLPAAEVPAGGATAGIWLIGLMAKAIGYPFFFLSATAPLLQSWFARTTHKDAGNPYFLYSASNIGSLGSLIAYPFIVEPLLGLGIQSQLWSIGYGALIAGIAASGWLMLQAPHHETTTSRDTGPSITLRQRLWWVFMSFVPSALLVAWTNHITTDIASAPFLWLPPLVLYLLTFVLVFREKSLVSLRVARVLQLAALPVSFLVQFALPLWLAAPVMAIGAISFFATAIICHRQLYEARPNAHHLTEFYMLMSLGGVLGGLFVSLLAPLVFKSVAEYPILLLIGVAAAQGLLTDKKVRAALRVPLIPVLLFVGLLALVAFSAKTDFVPTLFATRTLEIAFLATSALIFLRSARPGLAVLAMLMTFFVNLSGQPLDRVSLRSYFGVLSVTDNGPDGPFRVLTHGTTMHGAERLDELTPDYKDKPHALTYYSPQGGMARALLAVQSNLTAAGKQGTYRVVGLGTGSLACYSMPGEDWAYYEIDRDVIKIARDPQQFTFLSTCAPDMKMIEGDARITLAHGAPEKADYFLVDAFSSDSIPIHLITTEAMQLYLDHTKDDGVLVIHVTNRYMDLVPVVAANLKAIAPDIEGRVVDFIPSNGYDVNAMHSIVIIMSKNKELLSKLDQQGNIAPLTTLPGVDKWTDDFSNLPSAIYRRINVTKY